jgi:betaine-aldehyde dehydrogenase
LEQVMNFVAGEWVEASSGRRFASYNPASGEEVATAPLSDRADAAMAARTARDAFEGSQWAEDPSLRSRILWRWAQALESQAERLARILTLENGKPLRESRIETGRADSAIRFYAGLARALYGRTLQLSPTTFSMINREPVGVVAVIVPWNWPVTLLIRSLAPALAAGNTVVVKPASYTPWISAEVLRPLLEDPELPRGVVNFVTGPGSTVGDELVTSPQVDMVAFTGDSATGKAIMQAASGTLKKLALELGGKSPNIIFSDADLSRALPAAAEAIFTTSGQICTAGSRLLVERSIKDQVVTGLAEIAGKLKVGPGLQEDVDMGPIISAGQLDRILSYVEVGKSQARLVAGGHRLSGPVYERGFFLAPTIFDDVPTASPLFQEEIFGPVLAVEAFETEEEAVELANATPYGLSAGLWTRDLNRMHRVARRIKAGTVWVNQYNRFYPEVEVGGYKESGIGRQYGLDGLLEFTHTKSINLEIAPR